MARRLRTAVSHRYLGMFGVIALVVGVALSTALSAGASAATASAGTKSDSSARPPLPKGAVVVSAFHSRYGRVLVTSKGMPLYVFSGDALPFSMAPGALQLACTALNTAANGIPCTKPWPPLLATGPLVARQGVKQSALGTLTRDHVTQVTYHGRPLYTFFKDTPYHPAGEDITAFKGAFHLESLSGAPDAGVAKIGLEVSPAGVVLSTPTTSGARSVYTLTFDPNQTSTCKAACTAIWPPVLSTRRPVAMAGTDPRLLGRIRRPSGAFQVTYAGRPLYMFAFDLSTGAPAGLTNGEDFADSFAHGVWYTLSPQGTPDSATAVIETESSSLGTVLAYKSGFTGAAITLYAYSTDTSSMSTCRGACARYWPPVLTTTAPLAAGTANSSLLGEIQRPNGTFQVTYGGHPLYFSSQNLNGTANSAGFTLPGAGTFDPVAPSGTVS